MRAAAKTRKVESMRLVMSAVSWLLIASVVPALGAETVTIGIVPAISAAASYMAVEKGYFRDAGIEVQFENFASASPAMPLLASNRLQVVEGGLAVGYFNALAQKLPVIMALERGSSPLNHDLLLRPDLKAKIKTIADLKGHSIALSAPGSAAVYEVGKVLETAGLTLADVDVKYIGFADMGVALANRAVDVLDIVPPFGGIVLDKGIGVRWIDPDTYIKPQPVLISAYIANSDWAASHGDLARRLFLAIVRGARDYCQAYHHGPNRGEVIDVLVKNGAMRDRDVLDRMPWQARDPNGRLNAASAADQQDWYAKAGLIKEKQPVSRLLDPSYAEYAASHLPPFKLVNEASALEGCH
jgi:NitT/TauT family transport system substrate-binding protein